jgi:hypothetical protein
MKATADVKAANLCAVLSAILAVRNGQHKSRVPLVKSAQAGNVSMNVGINVPKAMRVVLARQK